LDGQGELTNRPGTLPALPLRAERAGDDLGRQPDPAAAAVLLLDAYRRHDVLVTPRIEKQQR